MGNIGSTCSREDNRGVPLLRSNPAHTICSVSTSLATLPYNLNNTLSLEKIYAVLWLEIYQMYHYTMKKMKQV